MEFEIREISDNPWEDIRVALELLNRTQGNGLFPEEYLLSKIESSRSFVVAGYMAGQFVAVGCADLLDDITYYTPFDKGIEKRLAGKKAGALSTLSVTEELQGQGLGQKLSLERMKWIQRTKCDVALGISWVSNKPHTSDRVFEKLGFEKVARVEGFFQEQARKQPFDCPGCKTQPCQCAAILYEFAF